jgi:hypothetical protein
MAIVPDPCKIVTSDQVEAMTMTIAAPSGRRA